MKPFVIPTVCAAAAVFLGACDGPQPTRPADRSGFHPAGDAQPAANPDVHPADPAVTPHAPEPSKTAETSAKPSAPIPPPPAAEGKLLYGKPVPGKPGFVFNPYDDSKGYIDVRGFPPGTEVKDPVSGKNFLVP